MEPEWSAEKRTDQTIQYANRNYSLCSRCKEQENLRQRARMKFSIALFGRLCVSVAMQN